ncbi:MAG: GNAT family N-acetyltransferase [Alphaproteobacteria bacterium]|jgi:RimJ/RimL family protein N-acetyltransferase|nr:GNAT family N-acetyltransferase [Alphaproteobacteria bacterium]MDP6815878.1 GNAT family N-acetyltransferase [Alphaproteobacteria bacterium]
MGDAADLPDLETARLLLRPRTLDDLDACLAMDMDAEVGRYLYPDGRPTREQRHQQLLAQMADGGGGGRGSFWTVRWRQEPEFLGWCGLFPLEQSGLVEIGYRYVTATWGRGVATEAAARVLDFGFLERRLDPIVAVTHPDNLASQRVLAKIGLRAEGRRFHYGLDLAFFSLARADYFSMKDRPMS